MDRREFEQRTVDNMPPELRALVYEYGFNAVTGAISAVGTDVEKLTALLERQRQQKQV